MDTQSKPMAWLQRGRYDLRISWNDRSLLDKLSEKMGMTRPQVLFTLLRERAEKEGIEPDEFPSLD
jgi:hypothetical protein